MRTISAKILPGQTNGKWRLVGWVSETSLDEDPAIFVHRYSRDSAQYVDVLEYTYSHIASMAELEQLPTSWSTTNESPFFRRSSFDVSSKSLPLLTGAWDRMKGMLLATGMDVAFQQDTSLAVSAEQLDIKAYT